MNKEIEELRQQLEQKKEELRKLELSCLDVCEENTALEKKLAQAQLQLKHQLNRAIAESMGWKCFVTETQVLGIRKTHWQKDGVTYDFGPNYLDETNPGPSHQLIEMLRLDAWRFKWQLWPNSEDNHATFTRGKVSVTVIAPTFCRAVAEAFAKCKGIWKE